MGSKASVASATNISFKSPRFLINETTFVKFKVIINHVSVPETFIPPFIAMSDNSFLWG